MIRSVDGRWMMDDRWKDYTMMMMMMMMLRDDCDGKRGVPCVSGTSTTLVRNSVP